MKMTRITKMGGGRTLPKRTCGRKPESIYLKRGTCDMLRAALRLWEVRQGIPQLPSVWDRMRSGKP